MPFLKLQSNESFLNTDEILQEATALITEMLDKPEKFIMVSVEENHEMIFGGSKDPMFYCEFKSIGLPAGRTREISEKLTKFLTEKTGIPADRIYIEFTSVERSLWGWNGGTFEK